MALPVVNAETLSTLAADVKALECSINANRETADRVIESLGIQLFKTTQELMEELGTEDPLVLDSIFDNDPPGIVLMKIMQRDFSQLVDKQARLKLIMDQVFLEKGSPFEPFRVAHSHCEGSCDLSGLEECDCTLEQRVTMALREPPSGPLNQFEVLTRRQQAGEMAHFVALPLALGYVMRPFKVAASSWGVDPLVFLKSVKRARRFYVFTFVCDTLQGRDEREFLISNKWKDKVLGCAGPLKILRWFDCRSLATWVLFCLITIESNPGPRTRRGGGGNAPSSAGPKPTTEFPGSKYVHVDGYVVDPEHVPSVRRSWTARIAYDMSGGRKQCFDKNAFLNFALAHRMDGDVVQLEPISKVSVEIAVKGAPDVAIRTASLDKCYGLMFNVPARFKFSLELPNCVELNMHSQAIAEMVVTFKFATSPYSSIHVPKNHKIYKAPFGEAYYVREVDYKPQTIVTQNKSDKTAWKAWKVEGAVKQDSNFGGWAKPGKGKKSTPGPGGWATGGNVAQLDSYAGVVKGGEPKVTPNKPKPDNVPKFKSKTIGEALKRDPELRKKWDSEQPLLKKGTHWGGPTIQADELVAPKKNKVSKFAGKEEQLASFREILKMNNPDAPDNWVRSTAQKAVRLGLSVEGMKFVEKKVHGKELREYQKKRKQEKDQEANELMMFGG